MCVVHAPLTTSLASLRDCVISCESPNAASLEAAFAERPSRQAEYEGVQRRRSNQQAAAPARPAVGRERATRNGRSYSTSVGTASPASSQHHRGSANVPSSLRAAHGPAETRYGPSLRLTDVAGGSTMPPRSGPGGGGGLRRGEDEFPVGGRFFLLSQRRITDGGVAPWLAHAHLRGTY